MKIRRCIQTAVLAFIVGCGPSVSLLEKHLNAGAYDKAVSSAANDPKMQVELAALVLERAASHGIRSFELINFLAGSGKPGRRALERLAGRSDKKEGRLARVMLKRGSLPKKEERRMFFEDESSDVRALAAKLWCNESEADVLKKLLVDNDPRVRNEAVRGLSRFEGANGLDALVRDALRLDPDPKVRAQAARHGNALGPDAILILKKSLGDTNLGVRLAALQGLAETGTTVARDILEEEMLGSLDEMAVAAAAELARRGNAKGKARLKDALEDLRPNIRLTAMLRLERARKGNRDKICAGLLEDEAPAVVLAAAQTLSFNVEYSKSVIDALLRLVVLESARSDEARDMLAVLGHEASLAEVIQVLNQDDETNLLLTLARVGRAKALKSVFAELMAHPSKGVRIGAAQALLNATRVK